MSCDKNCVRKGTNSNLVANNSNRIDGQCPVYNMHDGRHFTDYRPRTEFNNSIVKSTNGSMNSYEYRMNLQHNAGKIMDDLRTYNYNENVCVPCYGFDQYGTMLPELNKVQCNEFTCTTSGYNPNGLGQGRDYNVNSNHPMMKHQEKSVDKFVYQSLN